MRAAPGAASAGNVVDLPGDAHSVGPGQQKIWRGKTVDGRNPANQLVRCIYVCMYIYIYHISHYLLFMTPVDFGSLSHYLHGFIHPSWLALGFLPSTGTLDLPANYPRMLINLKLLHVILVVTSQHPGWGEVDPTYTE